MFVKQRLRLPKVDPLMVGNLTLADVRHLDRTQYTKEAMRPLRRAWLNLQIYLAARRPNVQLCGDDPRVRREYDKAFAEHRRTHKDATTDDFDEHYAPTIDDSEEDPRLGHLAFTVQRRGKWIGLFNIYNVRILRERPARLVIAGSPCPSFGLGDNYMDSRMVGDVMLALLENDLKITGKDRVLDLKEWRFPSRRGHRWVSRDGSEMAAGALLRLAAHEKTEGEDAGDVYPKIIRRV